MVEHCLHTANVTGSSPVWSSKVIESWPSWSKVPSWKEVRFREEPQEFESLTLCQILLHSSRGLGHRPFTATTPVRIRYGVPSNGVLAQLVRAQACHAWGHGFEPRTHRQIKPLWYSRCVRWTENPKDTVRLRGAAPSFSVWQNGYWAVA